MAQHQDHHEYLLLHQCNASNANLDRIECGTLEQRTVWEARRACFRHGRYPAPGKADTTKEALRTAHAQTLLCKDPACRHLVDLQSARRIARKAGRNRFELGDGCGSRSCSAKHWKARFRRQQLKMATALRAGDRVLVLWPEGVEGRVELSVAPAALTRAVADAVAARPACGFGRAPAPTHESRERKTGECGGLCM